MTISDTSLMTPEELNRVDSGESYVDQEAALAEQLKRMEDRLRNNRIPEDSGRRRETGGEREGGGRGGQRVQGRRRRSTVDLEEEYYHRSRKEKEDRRRRERGSTGRSLSPREMSPNSALGAAGRPSGYDREQINRMGVQAALQLKGWEREMQKEREALIAKPGRKVVDETKPRTVEEVKGAMDDGDKSLSEGRFLRPPKDNEKMWERIPRAYEGTEGQNWAKYSGTAESMPSSTFLARQDREVFLPAKFWSKKVRSREASGNPIPERQHRVIIIVLQNFMADSRELREHLGGAGNLRVIGTSRRYKEIQTAGEVLTAIVNYSAANRYRH